jgi:HEAT repeat protein
MDMGKIKRTENSSQIIAQTLTNLTNPDDDIRTTAVITLSQLKASQAVKPLMHLLSNDKSYKIRPNALAALGEIGEPEAIPILIEALQDYSVLGQAAKALQKFKDVASIQPLIEVITKSRYAHHFASVVDTLVGFGEPAVIPLIKSLEAASIEAYTTIAATLVQIGDKRAIEPLINFLLDYDLKLELGERLQLAESLTEFGSLLSHEQLEQILGEQLRLQAELKVLLQTLVQEQELDWRNLTIAVYNHQKVQTRLLPYQAPWLTPKEFSTK